MYSAIILSGGKGRRMEKNLPKQYMLLAGKPIIMHSLERIDSISDIDEIIVVCENEYANAVHRMVEQYNISTTIIYANAGATRQESVYSGLQKVSNDNVIIHEAARPFVKREDFYNLINEPSKNVTLGYPIHYTVVQGQNCINSLLDREMLVNIQLPQKFETSILKKAHEIARNESKKFTEDSGMVYDCTQTDVRILRGSSQNIKITEPIDMIVGEMIYKEYIRGRR